MNMQDVAQKLIEMAQRCGAADADALAIMDTGESIKVRQGKPESVEREDACGIGLRAFVDTADGLAFASASSADVSDEGLARLAEQAVAMARISAADPDAVPPSGSEHPEPAELAAWKQRHHDAAAPWTGEDALAAALAAEAAALRVSAEIGNSEGAEASFGLLTVAYAAADGFASQYGRGSLGLALSVVAGSGADMQRDYAYDQGRHLAALRPADAIGREAAERAVRRLHPGTLKSGRMPVVFEPRCAASLLGNLAGAANGRAVLQQRSFLADKVGQAIFPDFVRITDNPDHAKGTGNRLFDGEGTRCAPMCLVEGGKLQGLLTDRYAAGRLGTTSTGHARRGLTGDLGIGPSNLIMEAGRDSLENLLHGIGDGVLITELMGFGVNAVTGDYSRGAAGFLIEHGQVTRPVSGFTIAGNLVDMYAGIIGLADDLTWFGSKAVPSIAIAGMTVAGQ
jgi:PmbA protein